MSPPPEYSHSFAQTSDELDDVSSKRLSQLNPLHDIDENVDVAHDDVIQYPEASPEELTHPPDFRPFFTLVQDADTGENHHPNIHYIFSDDDPAFLTSAIIENVARQTDPSYTPQNGERVVVLDVGADGKTIINAQSLSPDWQLTSANLIQAPSWHDENAAKRDGSLMLNISGMESHPLRIQPHKKGSVESMLGRVESVITGYSERLSALDKLVKKDVLEQTEHDDASGQQATNVDAQPQ